MPRQNRVTPFGEIIATPERGTLMGNRGVLHDREQRIRRNWRLKRWILCVLSFKGRHREIMTEGRWTELFFLDEATGLAAGHRPCAECQRARYLEFRNAWTRANRPDEAPSWPRAEAIDDRLHADRLDEFQRHRGYRSKLDALPDGVFVTLNESSNQPVLIHQRRLLAWSPGGYTSLADWPRQAVVRVLTPCSTVAAIRAGFTPRVHPSADRLAPRPQR
jgi:hypothetical protein